MWHRVLFKLIIGELWFICCISAALVIVELWLVPVLDALNASELEQEDRNQQRIRISLVVGFRLILILEILCILCCALTEGGPPRQASSSRGRLLTVDRRGDEGACGSHV